MANEDGIFVMKTDGGGERKVIAIDGIEFHRSPRWSHDGKRLAFETLDDRGARKSYCVNLDGTELKELCDLGSPDWSPDDRQLVFDSDDGMTSSVWMQNIDGGGRSRLTDGAWPRWSPDGKRIAFCDGPQLKVRELATGSERLLTEAVFAQRPGSFDWSRDGKRLAFFTRTGTGSPRKLYIINADHPNKEEKPRFSREGMVGGHVTWSLDDKQLIFTIQSMIYVLDVDGSAEPRPVPDQSDNNRDPACSPNGKWIAFARRPN